jgi:hypothetical protein
VAIPLLCKEVADRAREDGRRMRPTEREFIMRTLKCLLFSAGMLLSVTSLVVAQGRGRSGDGHYNPATEVVFSGTVDDVQHSPAPGRGQGGLHLIVRAETVRRRYIWGLQHM